MPKLRLSARHRAIGRLFCTLFQAVCMLCTYVFLSHVHCHSKSPAFRPRLRRTCTNRRRHNGHTAMRLRHSFSICSRLGVVAWSHSCDHPLFCVSTSGRVAWHSDHCRIGRQRMRTTPMGTAACALWIRNFVPNWVSQRTDLAREHPVHTCRHIRHLLGLAPRRSVMQLPSDSWHEGE